MLGGRRGLGSREARGAAARVVRRRVVDVVDLGLVLLEVPQVAKLAGARVDRALEGLNFLVDVALRRGKWVKQRMKQQKR